MSIGDKLYCFDDEGAMMRNTFIVIAGVTYSIDNDGYVTVEGNSKLAKMIRSGIDKLVKAYLDEIAELDDDIDPSNAYHCSRFVTKILSDIGINVRSLANRQQHLLSHSGEYDFEYVDLIIVYNNNISNHISFFRLHSDAHSTENTTLIGYIAAGKCGCK